MGEAAAAAEGLIQRRIEFHAAKRPRGDDGGRAVEGGAAVAGRFWVESLSPDDDNGVAAAAVGRSEGQCRRSEKMEGGGSGMDSELCVARIYLRRIGAGLQNLGNTCYLNSVLQCLTYTEPFVAYLQSGKHRAGISRSFRFYRQEDAHELMVSLLESMHRCCLPSGVPIESPSAYEKSLVHRIFGGRLRSQVRCTTCSHCSNKFDPFLDLSLEIVNATTLVKALKNFTEEELLDGGEKQYNCERCKQKVTAKKRFMIEKAPSVLTIHLKRFSPFNPRRKIDKKVEFQPTLNLKPYVSNPEGMEFKYSLYGVLVHAGWNTQSGHYYCFVRTSSGIWHNLDDNQVYQVREADVLRQKAYMLFYVCDRPKNSGMYSDYGTVNSSVNKIISEKITCMNGPIKNDLVETKTPSLSSFVKDVNLQKQNSDNGQSSIISNAPKGQCSKIHSDTEVLEGAAYPNNDSASTQKAFCIHPDAAAVTLPTETEQRAADNQRDITSPTQADISALHNGSCNQKAYEKQLQEHKLESNDASTDPGKDAPSTLHTFSVANGILGVNDQSSEPHISPYPAALPIHNVGEGLLGANSQAFEPHTGPCPAALPVHNGGEGLLGENDQSSEPHPDLCTASLPIQNDGEGLLGANGQASEPSEPHTGPCTAALPVHNGGERLLGANDQSFEPHTVPISPAFPVCNGVNVLLEAYGQASGPTNSFCKPIPTISDTMFTAQIIPSEDTAVSNITVSSSDDLTGNTEAKESSELVMNYDEQVVEWELSAKNSGDRANADEQTSVQDNTLEVGQNATKDLPNAEVESEKQICPGISTTLICSEDSAQLVDKDPGNGKMHKKMNLKSKRQVKYPVSMFFGHRQLLLASVKLHKKRKHKRSKRRHALSVDIESIITDKQTSTSETVLLNNMSHKSRGKKRSCAGASSDDGTQLFNKKQHIEGAFNSVPVDSKDAKLASAELPSSCTSSVVHQTDPRNSVHANNRAPRHFNLLTRGLREITVSPWDDNDTINTKETETLCSRTISIGYVLDEWDEEYDRGRRKKVRKSKHGGFSGPNPFQEMTNIKSRQRMRLQSDQAKSGNQPLRI
uniref:USP domain-containing protein n=1 Tax=Leersia perrieri TaxID=77586 RepID=A0A0D9VM48_9ORYZ